METNEVKIHTADPSALGLTGLALVTLVASSAKLGWTDGTSLIIPWAIFLGAAAQFIACLKDFQEGNKFGATAFGGYAFFWLSVSMSWMTLHGVFGEAMAANADVKQLGFGFLGYTIFSIIMTIGSLTTNKNLTVIFVLIDFLLVGLTISTLTGSHLWHEIAAYSELLVAIASFYGVAGHILNTQFKKIVVPLGSPFYKVK